jgi:hypothetical protein
LLQEWVFSHVASQFLTLILASDERVELEPGR